MGAAYTALATDAYALAYNPAGLAFTPSLQIAAQHLSYVESIHYEHVGAAFAPTRWGSFGASVQYLGSGDMRRTDVAGNALGEFSSHYAGYTLGYAKKIGSRFALGLSGKRIEAKISDVRATAYAVDAGALLRVTPRLTVGAVAAHWGSSLEFLGTGDRLPRTIKVGVAYELFRRLLLSADGVYRPDASESAHVGAEWIPVQGIALRTGYRSDLQKESNGLTGMSAGIGITLWNQELAYAWVPYGDLGTTQTISFVARFGLAPRERNLTR